MPRHLLSGPSRVKDYQVVAIYLSLSATKQAAEPAVPLLSYVVSHCRLKLVKAPFPLRLADDLSQNRNTVVKSDTCSMI